MWGGGGAKGTIFVERLPWNDSQYCFQVGVNCSVEIGESDCVGVGDVVEGEVVVVPEKTILSLTPTLSRRGRGGQILVDPPYENSKFQIQSPFNRY